MLSPPEDNWWKSKLPAVGNLPTVDKAGNPKINPDFRTQSSEIAQESNFVSLNFADKTGELWTQVIQMTSR